MSKPLYENATRKEKLSAHLMHIRNRLAANVGPYIDLVEEYAKNNQTSAIKAIGNFSLLRMIFPIIEAVARAEDKKPQELLEELEVPSPYLTWSLFRDVFSHSDEFSTAFYEEGDTMYIAHPGILIAHSGEQANHEIQDDKLIISPVKIYKDLITHLDNYPASDEEIDVSIGIVYRDLKNEEVAKIVEELKPFAGKYKRDNKDGFEFTREIS